MMEDPIKTLSGNPCPHCGFYPTECDVYLDGEVIFACIRCSHTWTKNLTPDSIQYLHEHEVSKREDGGSKRKDGES